ncbi:MAG TPA: hypothetical protein VGN25_06785 [Solirubrobacteraceae bacterium]|jgi:hypothetical protein|nr:hypothetical protein [Solirubrobacteraceae bacterium]
MADFAYDTRWFADAVVKHDAVLRASALPSGHVSVERKSLSSITVAPLGTPRIDTAVVESVLASCVPSVILLVPSKSHYDWSARELAEESGSTVHTVKELFTFMREPDPRQFVDKNVSYLWSLLETHSRVASTDMICEASMLVKRWGRLSDVVAAIEYKYEFGEAAFVEALERHPDSQVIINTNPSGGVTNAALKLSESAEVPILGVAEAMGALNFDTADFPGYAGSPRR